MFHGATAIDRRRCGTAPRTAQLVAKVKLKAGSDCVHELIIGTLFKNRVKAVASLADRPAIVLLMAGWARAQGGNANFAHGRDRLAHGFLVE